MANAVSTDMPLGRGMIALRVAAPTVSMPLGRALITINFPTAAMQTTQGTAEAAIRQNHAMEVTLGTVMVAARGRVRNPTVRAWTFTLDDHDFYVIRLGEKGTLVCDLMTGQWMDWDSFGIDFWRAATGFNWIGGNRFGPEFGSSVLVGDDTWGLLWFLDPDQGYDQHPDYLNPNQQLEFVRVAMGQVPLRGRDSMPCDAVFLSVNLGEPTISGAFVTLETSDDAGKTFQSQGDITIIPGEYRQEVSWLSLGTMEAPGRLFRFTDNGAFQRIDDARLNDDAG